jgi:hypothetical protein
VSPLVAFETVIEPAANRVEERRNGELRVPTVVIEKFLISSGICCRFVEKEMGSLVISQERAPMSTKGQGESPGPIHRGEIQMNQTEVLNWNFVMHSQFGPKFRTVSVDQKDLEEHRSRQQRFL